MRVGRLCIFFTFALAGCHAAPPASTLPPFTLQLTHYRGSALADRPAAALPDAPTTQGPLWDVQAEVSALAPRPSTIGVPLASRATLIAAVGTDSWLLPTASLTRSVRFIGPTDLNSELTSHTAGISQMTGALMPGVTCALQITDRDSTADTPQHVTLRVSPDPAATDSVVVALAIDAGAHEAAVWSMPLTAGQTQFGLIIPIAFAQIGPRDLFVSVHISPASQSAQSQEAAARCASDLTAASTAPPTLDTTDAQTLRRASLQSALESLPNSGHLRQTLVFLDVQGGARFCGDIALSADPDVLQRLAQAIHTQVTSVAGAPDEFAWRIDRVVLTEILHLSLAGRLPPQLAAVLTRYGGEAGRQNNSQESLLKSLQTRRACETHLIVENTMYLEDSSPAARARAAEWLAAHGHLPAGYDPLAPGDQRRAALAGATQPSGGDAP